MAELRLRVVGHYDSADVIARFDDRTTVGQLSDAVERATDSSTGQTRTLKRLSRSNTTTGHDEDACDLVRDTPLIEADIRSGDQVRLTLDSGVRSAHQDDAGALLRVANGTGEGQIFELAPGEFTVGRSSRCAISLPGDLVSRHHATFRVSDTIEVVDAGSRNGVEVNGEVIAGVRRLRQGDVVLLGDCELIIDRIEGNHGAIEVSDNSIHFNRPPRIERAFEPTTVGLPAPIPPPKPPRIPLITALVPLLVGTVLYLATRNVLTIMFIAMSPLLILGNFVERRRGSRRDHIAARAEYEATLHDRRIELDELRDHEIRTRHRFHPKIAEVQDAIRDLSPMLWERTPDHDDFLSLRVGLASAESQVAIEVPAGGTRDQTHEMNALVAEYAELPPVPVAVDLGGDSPVGLAGPGPVIRAIARWLIVQAGALHSPSELVICGLFPTGETAEWDWLKWLPHATNQLVAGVARPISSDGVAGTEWAVELQQLISARLQVIGTADAGGPRPLPRVLAVIDGSVDIERGRFSALLELGARVGVHTLWLSEDSRRVPNACHTMVMVEPGDRSLTVIDDERASPLGNIPIETMTLAEAELNARRLCPIVDIAAGTTAGSDLPATVSLVDQLGGAAILDQPERLAAVWANSYRSKSIAAPVGAYEAGLLTVDLRIDGPHGLVGGTTGSGKSEFLQSYLAAMALHHSPQRINFLLVDYKGGSAFGDLVDQFDDAGQMTWRGLPHTVGMITDLTPSLVQRALVSLRAELHRREMILNQHRVKDLPELERLGVDDVPANLLIVVDEFAALAKEVPAFVDGVVDIAQRGRSLGLHLLLATQKPGGVITPNIQANTNLRVALRMATEDESREVIRSPIAGRIDRSTPGRAVMRRGPADLVTFQSAYVGGITQPTRIATLELGEFGIEGVTWLGASNAATVTVTPAGAERDLRRIVRLANAAAQHVDLPPARRPWLDALPLLVSLFDLPRGPDDTAVPFGLVDLPEQQSREVAWFRPDDDASMLVFGMGGSGKTVLLRTLAVSAGLVKSRRPISVYGLDFAGRGLEMIAPLPHVGDVIGPGDYDRVTGLIKELEALAASRAARFAEASAASLAEYNAAHPDDRAARILVLVDGYDTFAAEYERIDRGRWLDAIPRLVAEGRSTGVHFVFTGTRRQSFPTALASQISARLVMRMATDDDYHTIGADPGWFDESSPSGRARLGPVEVQVALCGADPSTATEARTITETAEALAGQVPVAGRVRVLPAEFERAALPETTTVVRWLLTENFEPWGPALDQNVLVTGPPRSGKTTALASLIEALAERGVEAEVFAHQPSGLLPTAQGFDRLAERLESDRSGLIIIDDGDRISGSPIDRLVQEALQDDRHRLVVAVDTAHARGFDPMFKAFRARCDRCVLQPNPDQDGELLGRPIAKSAATYPPGRALVRIGEAVRLCHVGLPASLGGGVDRVVVPVE